VRICSIYKLIVFSLSATELFISILILSNVYLVRSDTLILGTSSSQAVGAASDFANAPSLPFGLSNQEPSTSGSAAGQLESRSSDVVEDNRFCVGSKMKLKSPVWNEIERVKVEDEWKGKCRWCNKLLSASSKNGTNHLKRHLESCQPRKAAKAGGSPV
jgi:hypothetical protein